MIKPRFSFFCLSLLFLLYEKFSDSKTWITVSLKLFEILLQKEGQSFIELEFRSSKWRKKITHSKIREDLKSIWAPTTGRIMREPIKFFRFSAERHFSVVAWWWLSANDWNLELRKDYSKSDLETFDVNIALFQKRCSKPNYDLWLNFPKKEGLSTEHSVLITPVCRLCFHVFLLSKEENFEKS